MILETAAFKATKNALTVLLSRFAQDEFVAVIRTLNQFLDSLKNKLYERTTLAQAKADKVQLLILVANEMIAKLQSDAEQSLPFELLNNVDGQQLLAKIFRGLHDPANRHIESKLETILLQFINLLKDRIVSDPNQALKLLGQALEQSNGDLLYVLYHLDVDFSATDKNGNTALEHALNNFKTDALVDFIRQEMLRLEREALNPKPMRPIKKFAKQLVDIVIPDLPMLRRAKQVIAGAKRETSYGMYLDLWRVVKNALPSQWYDADYAGELFNRGKFDAFMFLKWLGHLDVTQVNGQCVNPARLYTIKNTDESTYLHFLLANWNLEPNDWQNYSQFWDAVKSKRLMPDCEREMRLSAIRHVAKICGDIAKNIQDKYSLTPIETCQSGSLKRLLESEGIYLGGVIAWIASFFKPWQAIRQIRALDFSSKRITMPIQQSLKERNILIEGVITDPMQLFEQTIAIIANYKDCIDEQEGMTDFEKKLVFDLKDALYFHLEQVKSGNQEINPDYLIAKILNIELPDNESFMGKFKHVFRFHLLSKLKSLVNNVLIAPLTDSFNDEFISEQQDALLWATIRPRLIPDIPAAHRMVPPSLSNMPPYAPDSLAEGQRIYHSPKIIRTEPENLRNYIGYPAGVFSLYSGSPNVRMPSVDAGDELRLLYRQR